MSMTYTVQLRFGWAEAEAAFSKIIRNDGRFNIVDPNAKPAGLVIIEDSHVTNITATVEQLKNDPNVLEIFVLAKEKDPDLILSTLRAGATEFLPLPLKCSEFSDALNRFVDRRMYAQAQHAANIAQPASNATAPHNTSLRHNDVPQGQVVTVLGGKHGIGTTTISVNLAVCYAKLVAEQDKAQEINTTKAVLVDTRRPQGDSPLFLDLDYLYTWAEATRDASRLDTSFLQSLLIRHTSGLEVLAAPDHEESTGANPALAMERMLSMLKQQSPFTVLDCGPYIDEVSLAALEASDSILLVTELSLPCLGSSRRLMDTLENINPNLLDKVRLVINKHTTEGGITTSEAEELLGSRVAWRIEDDHPAVISAMNQGLPMMEAAPRSAATRSLQQMAEAFAQAEEESGSFLQRMFSGFAKSGSSQKQAARTSQASVDTKKKNAKGGMLPKLRRSLTTQHATAPVPANVANVEG